MCKNQKESDKLIIVVHKIYGINKHMSELCEGGGVFVLVPRLRAISLDNFGRGDFQ